MIDTVNGVLAERQALDRGFSSSLVLSGFGHFLLVAVAVLTALLAPRKPPLQVIDGFAVVLPRGGGGTPQAVPAATTPPAPEPPAPQAAPEPAPPPKILKPPKEEPKKGLPELDAKRAKPSKEKTPPTWVDPGASRTQGRPGASAASATPGLEFAAPGPGVPGGADSGDWYLASVQRKIWMIWMQQVKEDFSQQVSVQFTIMADGSVTDVRVTQPSGVSLLDLAAQRSVMSAAPFRPLPKDYETDHITIQANFKPNP